MHKKAKVVTPLLPHQQRVVDRIQGPNQPGLLVVHGLGSGKTLTSIAAQDALGMPASVVVPAALKGNYKKEQAKHLKGRHQPIALSTIQLAARSGKVKENPLLIIDEAHKLREPGSRGYQAIANSPSEKRLLLTGSPFYNRPNDIAPLINLAAGNKILPSDQAGFYHRYVKERVVRPGLVNRFRGVTPGIEEELNQRTAPELQRVFQKWVDYHPGSTEDFPEVEYRDISVPMTKKQLTYYHALENRASSSVRKKVRSGLPPSKEEAANLNAFLSAVRQVGDSTAPYQTEGTSEEPKIDAAFQNLQGTLSANARSKALIYSNYLNAGINPYKARLEKAHIPYGEFTGEMNSKKREQLVRDYNENKIRALLLSSAGGEGLDLKGTRLIQILEPHWNAEKIKQVEGRGIRYKSHEDLPPEERKVLVERYLSQFPKSRIPFVGPRGKSGDEYLAEMSAKKEKLLEQFRNLLPKEQAEPLKKTALLERLVRLGVTDIPRTPRLLMRERTPKELANIQNQTAKVWDSHITNPILNVAEKGIQKLSPKLQGPVHRVAKLVAEDPVGTLAANLIPIPGAHPAYIAGKKGLERLIDRVAPLTKT